MLDRFNVAPIFRGHWKGLTNGQYLSYRPDVLARLIMLLPIALFVFLLIRGATLSAPSALLTGAALLAGGMLSAFTHLSTLRLKITEWDGESGESRFGAEREMLDETAAHLLAGSLACILDAASLVVGMNLGLDSKGRLVGFWAAVSSGISFYVLLIFILILPRLYSAYVEINGVIGRLSGFTQGKGRD
ncbi:MULTISPECIES: hypothetical protein [unclassified Streptomyces]|uniref:hypothetical protein n=1 Tax=unclassified Streptomyces TaxID=2593676 RepID=UPI0033AC1192